MSPTQLIRKYNRTIPRYTSYPAVPHWNTAAWNQGSWLASVRNSYKESSENGISLYIHLPFCENLCTYCGCTTRITKNHAVEEPYINAVIAEWEQYVKVIGEKPRIKEIHLGGGTPTFFEAGNLQKLIGEIKSRALTLPEADFSFEAHPANTSIQHLEILFNEGFRRLSLGIQDFDPAVQKAINRKQTVQDVKLVTEQAREIGYMSINFDLIYGLPLQKTQSIRNTIQEVIKLRPDRIAFYSYAHVPWLKPGQRGFTELDLPQDNEKRALYELGRELLQAAGYEDVGMDHFALRTDNLFRASQSETLHRNFMGYTDQFTQLSIGLGISAISDSWYAFSQNAKQVEEYIAAMAQNEFYFLKGHLLDQEDLIIRQHILDIMCRAKTTLDPDWILTPAVCDRLEELEKDQLITLEFNTVKVTESGKPFLRNICSCFDQKLATSNCTTPTFSTSV